MRSVVYLQCQTSFNRDLCDAKQRVRANVLYAVDARSVNFDGRQVTAIQVNNDPQVVDSAWQAINAARSEVERMRAEAVLFQEHVHQQVRIQQQASQHQSAQQQQALQQKAAEAF